ncbi:ABC transporter ATP-binding protein [Phytohabitans houttuyneae]|uniref:ABC transporter ATP-binding protein n=1 Tax=Phytohabitans houttuyneae TaxID=1076126 RepID=A0A6V8KC24_9ACTN|nr:ABC transporter ATP-binding protein [Phytohabitans houttuyneae]GFJ82743.1 ABC transporter ATP-binding protein [Phytohabitans houttuyneae]
MDTLLRVRDLVVEAGPLRILDGVGFDVPAGQTLGVVGESGSGKTMTANAVLGLLPAGVSVTSGSIAFGGTELVGLPESRRRAVRGSDVAMVFQDPLAALNPVQPVGRQVSEVARRREGLSRGAAGRLAVELLDRVGVPDPAQRARAYPHQLSGGLRQRAVIAMALAGRPRLILADEPTTALDVSVQGRILGLLAKVQAEDGVSVLLISHDLRVMAHAAQRVAVMYAGRVVEQGATRELLRAPRHPYTAALVRSVPAVHTRSALVAPIPGNPPSLAALPSGCRFHPRCPLAAPRCRVEQPALREVGPDRLSACHRAEEVNGA